MTTAEKDWFLSLPKETKLKLLGDMLNEGESGMALATAKILLDAPISKGGISTEEINEVFDMNMSDIFNNLKI